jgi:signal transduction histidine kinase
VYRCGEDVLVDVTDDGDGFGPEALTPGHGLDNLRARLQTLYGAHARLDLARTPGKMTVRLQLPHASAYRPAGGRTVRL